MKKSPTAMTDLSVLVEKWSEKALALDWVKKWREGAIFPREMVFFVARCEQLGIRYIVESGRQDGYSTEILAEYSRDRNAEVYSIDYEADADRARQCRDRLKKYPELKLLRGDANTLVISTIRSIGGPAAIIMDGPKGFWAMSLMFAAAARDSVRLLSLHNLAEGEESRQLFQSLSIEPAFYEEFSLNGRHWRELTAAEIEFCRTVGATRSLEKSSLGVMSVTPEVRQRLLTTSHPKFKLYQPKYVRLGWQLGLYRTTSLLFSVSHRLPG